MIRAQINYSRPLISRSYNGEVDLKQYNDVMFGLHCFQAGGVVGVVVMGFVLPPWPVDTTTIIVAVSCVVVLASVCGYVGYKWRRSP